MFEVVEHIEGAFGAHITRGMEVVYPGRQGSSIWMSKGTVVDLGSGTNRWGSYSWITVERTDNTQRRFFSPPIKPRKVTITNVHLVVPFNG